MKKKLCLALSGALCLSAGVGCGTETAEETLTPVRLNEVVHSVFYAPQYVAQELGFFEEEGLDVSVAVGNGADKSMTALLSDSADIALLGTEAGLYVYAEGKADYPKTFAQPISLFPERKNPISNGLIWKENPSSAADWAACRKWFWNMSSRKTA